MKKTKADGSTYYYYYQKKIGRHRKRGRRKKKKLRGRRWQEGWDYKIIRFDFRKQVEYVGTYHDLDEVQYVKKILEEKNAKVVFPRNFSNNGNKSRKIFDFKSEYVVLKRVRDLEAGNVTQLRNEYGKFVEHFTTNENWAVYDKFPCLVEETFWVYGYSPHAGRKTFTWIFENLIKAHSEDKDELVMIYVYENKVIFKYEEDFSFVICKNSSDAIRMYNLIEANTKRIKNVLMTGGTVTKSERGRATVEMLMNKTGWSRRKVTARTTRS
ncbi:MAG: hypothetical protein J6Y37_17785 [Paludibacteraceae bacterium]|nr:hypothetical protein [Paludibacteraceae bacterium]